MLGIRENVFRWNTIILTTAMKHFYTTALIAASTIACSATTPGGTVGKGSAQGANLVEGACYKHNPQVSEDQLFFLSRMETDAIPVDTPAMFEINPLREDEVNFTATDEASFAVLNAVIKVISVASDAKGELWTHIRFMSTNGPDGWVHQSEIMSLVPTQVISKKPYSKSDPAPTELMTNLSQSYAYSFLLGNLGACEPEDSGALGCLPEKARTYIRWVPGNKVTLDNEADAAVNFATHIAQAQAFLRTFFLRVVPDPNDPSQSTEDEPPPLNSRAILAVKPADLGGNTFRVWPIPAKDDGAVFDNRFTYAEFLDPAPTDGVAFYTAGWLSVEQIGARVTDEEGCYEEGGGSGGTGGPLNVSLGPAPAETCVRVNTIDTNGDNKPDAAMGRSGPSTSTPAVMRYPYGTQLTVYGSAHDPDLGAERVWYLVTQPNQEPAIYVAAFLTKPCSSFQASQSSTQPVTQPPAVSRDVIRGRCQWCRSGFFDPGKCTGDVASSFRGCHPDNTQTGCVEPAWYWQNECLESQQVTMSMCITEFGLSYQTDDEHVRDCNALPPLAAGQTSRACTN